MRMFSLASWISESRGCDKVVHGVAPHLANAFNMHPADMTPVISIKRKRPYDDPTTEILTVAAPEAKRRKENPQPQSQPIVAPRDSTAPSAPRCIASTNTPETTSHKVSKPAAKPTMTPNQIRLAVESQFSLEILMKHNELRLINQELSKCQIALEQLRRCHLIPYPTTQSDFDTKLQISHGTGPAIEPRQGEPQPQWGAPFGVTDGPYTRHYAKWLIPDPSFDGSLPESEQMMLGTRAGKTIPEGRTTRNSFTDSMGFAGKSSRAQRGSTSQKLQALPSGYPQAKAQTGPPILKRADGQTVKLVCLDCQRENFASIQGFINHCRIAHRRDFKSHEEAAVHSGHPIEVDELGSIVGEKKEEQPQPSAPVATGLVHPMIRNAPTDSGAYAALLSRIEESLQLYQEGKLAGVTSIPGAPIQAQEFVASTETPHLSRLLQRRGFNGNLDRLVGEAKKVEIVEDSQDTSSDEDSDAERTAQTSVASLDGTCDSPVAHGPAMRVPARSDMSPAPYNRPGSSKGPEEGKARRKPSISSMSPRLPFAALDTSSMGHSRPAHMQFDEHDPDLVMLEDTSIDLSPHTTASNNAPSLVSDDGEYDDGFDGVDSDIDGVNDSDDGSDVAEIDIEDGDGVDKDVSGAGLRHGNREGAGRMRLRKEEKHVTFVSPVKEGRRERKVRASK